MLLQITYHDKATQTETEEEDTIEKILKAITTLCTKVDSMDNEIQKLKTNEDNLKSKASISQQHDYKNAELCRSEDRKNLELKGDVGKHLKTHNIWLNTAAVSRTSVTLFSHFPVPLPTSGDWPISNKPTTTGRPARSRPTRKRHPAGRQHAARNTAAADQQHAAATGDHQRPTSNNQPPN
ncbi:hypothetical protein MTR67_001077 [Solanum verrucosum]|uniref:Uncharacterized protein n=1 Tax=Solanum verrucosum TaxID=315347 RepID=A0AAF0PMY4_SOLVR|nr:hypothetical protein MTR67_001077 [Solanum verrucosum]